MNKVTIREMENVWHVNFNGDIEYEDKESQKENELGVLAQSVYALLNFIETNYDVEQENILIGVEAVRQYREKHGLDSYFEARTEN